MLDYWWFGPNQWVIEDREKNSMNVKINQLRFIVYIQL